MLGQIKDSDLQVYAIWVPSLPADVEEKVSFATTKLTDERVSHFWDGEGKLKKAYQSVTKIDKPAWDVYYVYGRNAEWKGDLPPAPNYWMHQLNRLPKEQMLNGETLAEEIKKLIQEPKTKK